MGLCEFYIKYLHEKYWKTQGLVLFIFFFVKNVVHAKFMRKFRVCQHKREIFEYTRNVLLKMQTA